MTDNVTPEPKPAEQTPPWGAEENFDAARAWTLIQGLRSDKEALTAERDSFRTDAETATTERDAAVSRAEAAEASIADSERSSLIARTLAKHGLPEDVGEFLTGADEAALEAQAARLAAVAKPATPEPTPGEKPAEEPATPPSGGRPAPGLKPGHGGDEREVIDLDALVADAR